MGTRKLFTSESVSEGHPDKMADQISDAVVDAILAEEPKSRIAAETMIKTGFVVLAGEIKTNAKPDFEEIVRNVICDIGYDDSDKGFVGKTCGILNALGKQSDDINMGVDRAEEKDQGAGDQGMMFGYASNETDVLMPAPITYSHRLVEQQAKVRKNGTLPWLLPDAKSQLTFIYEDNKPIGIDAQSCEAFQDRIQQFQLFVCVARNPQSESCWSHAELIAESCEQSRICVLVERIAEQPLVKSRFDQFFRSAETAWYT